MSPEQSRAGRALLNWSQPELVKKSGLSIATVKRFESGQAPVSEAAVEAMRQAMESAGVEFIENGAVSHSGGEGARFKKRFAK